MSAGSSIARGIKDWKQAKKEDKAAKAVYEAVTPPPGAAGETPAHPFGVSKEEFEGMSRDDRIAFTQGNIEALSIKNAMAKMQAEQEDQDFQQVQRAAGQRFQRALAPMPAGMAGPEQPMDARRILGAAADSGYQLAPRIIAQFAKEGGGANWDEVMPRPFEINGVKGAVGKSGQFQFLPQATPETLQAIPVMDDEGNIVDMRVPTGKGGSAPLRQPKANKDVPPSFYEPYHKLRDSMETATSNAALTDAGLVAYKMGKETPADTRKRFQSNAAEAAAALQKHLKLYKAQNYGTPEFWQELETDTGAAKAGGVTQKYNPTTRKLE